MFDVLHMPSFFLACKLFPSKNICQADINTQKREAGNVLVKLRLNYKDTEYLHVGFRIVAQ